MKMRGSSMLKEREALHGYLFVIPLLFGLVVFFIIPFVKTLLMSISDVFAGTDGYTISITGFGAYYDAFFSNNEFRPTVVLAVRDMLITTPLVIIFSFFMAAVLNQKFKGRTVFRVILFIPVIIAMTVATTNSLESQMSGFSSYKDTFGSAASSFTTQIAQYLKDVGVDKSFADTVTSIADKVYDVIKLSGIQILIMLTGMQSISPSLYEAAKVEGGTAWENFWKITFPMVSPLVLTSLVYTVVDSFTSSGNGVMKLVQSTAFTSQHFSLASAMSFSYFIIVGVILALVAWIMSKFVFYYDN